METSQGGPNAHPAAGLPLSLSQGDPFARMVDKLPPLSHLECASACGHRLALDRADALEYLRNGWPACHGLTMRLVTMKEAGRPLVSPCCRFPLGQAEGATGWACVNCRRPYTVAPAMLDALERAAYGLYGHEHPQLSVAQRAQAWDAPGWDRGPWVDRAAAAVRAYLGGDVLELAECTRLLLRLRVQDEEGDVSVAAYNRAKDRTIMALAKFGVPP